MRTRRPAALALGVVTLLTLTLALTSVVLAGGRPYVIDLTGEAEVTAAGVPNQGDLDGTGTVRLTLNPGTGEVCYEFEVHDVATILAAHIHGRAPSTTTASVLIPMSPTGSDAADGTWSGCTGGVDRGLILAIFHEPELYYVNVHNQPYPGGALRGQLG